MSEKDRMIKAATQFSRGQLGAADAIVKIGEIAKRNPDLLHVCHILIQGVRMEQCGFAVDNR